MVEVVGVFDTLVIDELMQEVRLGPTTTGGWAEVGGWGEREWEVLVAIASHPRGAYANDAVRRAHQQAIADRKVVFRIRERFRRHGDIPRACADELIITRRFSSTFQLNPRIKARFLPARLHGAAAFGEPRALDSMLHAITRAGVELFGEIGLQQAIARLPDDARRETFEIRHAPGRWIPVRHITSWMRAVHDGPAGLSREAFAEFVRRVERYRLSPYFVDYLRCHKARLIDIRHMWRTCYDSGDFEAALGSNNDFLELRLWNHPYCHSERSARAFALCWQAIAEVFDTQEARVEACEVEALSGALRIRIAGAFAK